jgi:hypothetical protein
MTYSFGPHYGPRVDSASSRNEYQGYSLGRKGGRWVGLTTLILSCDDYLEICSCFITLSFPDKCIIWFLYHNTRLPWQMYHMVPVS